MNQGSLRRLERLFHEAADLPAAERSAFLEHACGDDGELLARLAAMLEELDADETLERPVVERSGPEEGPGAVVDRYQLLEKIGEGGFGTVYMAEQRQPVRRKVALKIIKRGMDSREVVARFEAERQALALMDHGAIAKVLDGGTTPSGLPYFVMELVRGVPITDFCDAHRLGIRERLRIFVDVCLAVQHAHQKGVVHRDLKPSNVLVTDQDGRLVPKVIDFGIAKAVEAPLTERTLLTRFRQFLGTPAYMSPEQAGPAAEDVDTRADIYSLGVLLYELLTGTTPFDATELCQGGLAEMERVLREVEPPRPSARISTTGDAAVAARRNLDVPALARFVRGDLDWIIMQALAKERAARYAAASDLAADIGRHLAGEPVLAGPPSALYRTRKFLLRHHASVVAAAVVVLVLVAGTIGTGLGFVEASRQREAARSEADYAHAVTGFLVDTLELTDPELALQPEASVSLLLDRAAAEIDGAFPERPRAEARVRTTIGRAYASLGQPERAEVHLRRAAGLLDALGGARGGERYGALWSLTNVLFRLDRDDAYATAARAHEVGLAWVAASHPVLAAKLERFYRSAFEAASGTADAAPTEGLFAAAKLEADAGLAPGDELWLVVADTFQAAAMTFWYRPGEAASEPFFRATLAIRRRELAAGHPEIGKTLGHLVRVLNRAGKSAEAEILARQALEVLRAVGESGYFQLAFVESLLGETLVAQGRFVEAEPLLLDSHRVIVETVGSESRFFAVDSFARLITLYTAWGREAEAAPHRAVLAQVGARYKWPLPWPLARLAFGPQHAGLRELLERLRRVGNGAELDGIAARIVASRRAALAADEPLAALVARFLLERVEVLSPGASPAAADAGYRQLVEEAAEVLGHFRDEVPLAAAEALARLSEVASGDGSAVRAAELARQAWDLLRRDRAGDHWVTVNTRLRVAGALLAQGLIEEAEGLLLASHAALASQLGEGHSDTRRARAMLAELDAAAGTAGTLRRRR